MKLIGQYDVRLPGDVGESCINSMAILPNQQVVLVDLGNASLKLLDANLTPLASYMFGATDPWDITCVSGTDVAVTLPEANRVQLLYVAGATIEAKDSIDVGMWCTGIAYVGDKDKDQGELYIYVMGGFDSLKYIGCFTLAGTMIRAIKIDETLFKQPQFLSYNATTGHVIISDWQRGVIGFRAADSYGCVYHADSSVYYWGTAQDDKGNVYIGCHKHNGIITVKHNVNKVPIRSKTTGSSKETGNNTNIRDTTSANNTSSGNIDATGASGDINKEANAKDTEVDLSKVMDVLGISVAANMNNHNDDLSESVDQCYMAATSFKPMDNIAFERTCQSSHTPQPLSKPGSKGKTIASKVPKEAKAKQAKGQLNKMQVKGRQLSVASVGKKGNVPMSNHARRGEPSTSKITETRPTKHLTNTELEPRAILYRSHNNTLVVSSFGASRNFLYVYKL